MCAIHCLRCARSDIKTLWCKGEPHKTMTNTYSFAEQELDILAETVPDAIISEFRNEILALCEAFGKSGQSGGSAPFTASALSQAVKKLCLQEPICDITGHESEWVNIARWMNEEMYQNKRCFALFKHSNGDCTYNDAIVWKGEAQYDTFTGAVYVDNKDFKLIKSSQVVKSFPFKPKTFYIDVVRIPVSKDFAESNNILYTEDAYGECYYSVVKDKSQLKKVFKYYKEENN